MRTENTFSPEPAIRAPSNPDCGIAAVGTVASIGALFSAAACCILPLGLAAFGIGSAGLSSVVPFHWPLTITAMIAIGAGWLFYARRRRACARAPARRLRRPGSTFRLLCAATAIVTISGFWSFIEAPLMRALGGQ
ncbi:MAG: hypothetical protein M3Q08_11095 [Pseudomonadota bacterium]|nr:hypothetical protein [Pseudomonadota bacterium]